MMRTNLDVIPTDTHVLFPTAESYKQYDQRTHVYMKPDTYIGADEPFSREEWLYDSSEKRMVSATINFVPGCERLYLEILTNASDNVGRSRRGGYSPGNIIVAMNNSTISVTNYGLPIPIEIHPEEGIYVPQMIFGSLLTSSNYEVERHEAGTNGLGGKATNIFSVKFKIILHNHNHQLKYEQTWSNNMTEMGEPIITPYSGIVSSTQVIYKMDFARFGYEVPIGEEGGYPPEAWSLFARHAIDISFTAKTTVVFNGEEFNFANIRDYAHLYFGDAVGSAVTHYQWPVGTELLAKRSKLQSTPKDPSVMAEVELIALDTPDEGSHVSFVNCMMTRDGGVHVNASIKAVGDAVVKMVNENVLKKLAKYNKGKELDNKDKRSHMITIKDVKPHISILLSVRVVNPKFTSQTKTVLHSPTPKIVVPEQVLEATLKWQLVDRLYAAIEAKQFSSISKTDGKLQGYIRTLKGIDANKAGKAQRGQCVLYVTEGRSGAGYANKLISLTPSSRDNIGVLPMRGKLFNVMEKDILQIEKNEEIKELKHMLGLCERIDYSVDANFNRLRYGALMVMADSDVDGKHIIGLILNFFHCRFPSLLSRGFVMYYRTPILRVTLGRNTLKFFSQEEYDRWSENIPNYKNYSHKYYKGLGTSKDKEVEDDYSSPRVVSCFYDENAPNMMKLAFHKDLADERKEWIRNWVPISFPDVKTQDVSWFIDHELILFSIANVQRSIPNLMDGIKESHRKILHGAHKKWKVGNKKLQYQEIKVAQFGAFVAEQSNYHHGETILGEVIIGMAQDFTGSNNIPWFTRDGQFGSRFEGGKDAADPRYLYTRPEKIMSFILRKEDYPILTPIIDEGQEVEPETYYPIVPMVLINGAYGIGTGYSTYVPNHNPLDIIEWIKSKLKGVKDLPPIVPWYRGFEGNIKVIDRRSRREKERADRERADREHYRREERSNEEREEMDIMEGEREEIYDPLLSVVTLGTFKSMNNGTIIISDLPVGRWPLGYRRWLDSLIEDKKITGFWDRSVGNTIGFEIYGFREAPTCLNLRLKRSMGMSNMVLLDENRKPVRYSTTTEILEVFFSRRLRIYQQRKDFIVGILTGEILKLGLKIKFIRAVISKEIRIINKKISEIRESLDRLEIPYDIYETSRTRNLSEDDIEILMAQIALREEERSIIQRTSPEDTWLKELCELEEVYKADYLSISKEKTVSSRGGKRITMNKKPPIRTRSSK